MCVYRCLLRIGDFLCVSNIVVCLLFKLHASYYYCNKFFFSFHLPDLLSAVFSPIISNNTLLKINFLTIYDSYICMYM